MINESTGFVNSFGGYTFDTPMKWIDGLLAPLGKGEKQMGEVLYHLSVLAKTTLLGVAARLWEDALPHWSKKRYPLFTNI